MDRQDMGKNRSVRAGRYRSRAFSKPGHDHSTCVSEALARAEAQCRLRGARLTPQRRRVLELIWTSHAPIGAYALLDSLRAAGIRAQPPTVYRALEFLVSHGLVHRIESQNAFVGCISPAKLHGAQFLICTNCRTAAELEDAAIRSAIATSARQNGFSISRATVEIAGLCLHCRRIAA
jgi:Fur family zinc uptake transcriptional regulator